MLKSEDMCIKKISVGRILIQKHVKNWTSDSSAKLFVHLEAWLCVQI